MSGVADYSVWDRGHEGQCCYSISSAKVDQALNGYFGESGEGKQEEYVKAKDGWLQIPIELLS